MINIPENICEAIGITLLLLIVTCAIGLLVMTSLKMDKYRHYKEHKLELEYGVHGLVTKLQEEYKPIYTKNTVLSLASIMIGIVPLVILSIIDEYSGFGGLDEIYGLPFLLIIVAIASNRLVLINIISDTYNQILEEKDYATHSKQKKHIVESVSTIYWIAILILFLGYSFTTNNWERSWIIWPVSGLLFIIVSTVLDIMIKKRIV